MGSIYASRNEAYKKPFGAVKAGERVSFTLRVPHSYGCETPYLLLQPDGGQVQQHLLLRTGEEEDCALFSLEIAPGPAGLYFYWFDLWVDYRKLYEGVFGDAYETTGEGRPYRLTVYEGDFKTPAVAHGGVMYQIFPDRFLEGDPSPRLAFSDRIYRADKRKEPYFWPADQADGKLTKDYFGGDLLGIERRLPFLYTLGVNWIYLNPIFEAHSNHRYNTADYLKVDPDLGTNEDFERLCKKAGEFGIRIILDGVFSHTGADSLYFNKESRYPTVGAWQGPGSPYRSWYKFNPDGSYASWWGFGSLPELNENDPGYRDFICGEGGVVDTWLQRGAAGFRLDVADELPDDFIAALRKAVKRNGEDKLLIGEVWEDASDKMAYGERRRYFLGEELDGVMNYPFRSAILDFLRQYDSVAFSEAVMRIVEHYPPPAMACCTTHLATHDTERAITALAGRPVDGNDRQWQSGRRLSPEEWKQGIIRLRLAFVLQFTLPGIPCVYYGDEIAMQGYKDPFNRGYYDWESGETALIPLMMELANLRKSCAAFKEGDIRFTLAENGMIAFERSGGGERAAVAVNCSGFPCTVQLLGEAVTVPMMQYAWRTQKEKTE